MNCKIAYFAIPNPTGTAADAPALPRVIPNGVANTNDVIADITDGIAASEARCRIALEAIVAVALEHVRNGETVDRKTGAELATAEVVTVSKGQRATCKFAAVDGGVAKGQYWLVVTTFGLIGETTPRVFRKPVTLVEAIPALPDPIATSPDGLSKVKTLNGKASLAELAPIPSTSAFTMTGDGLARYIGKTPFLVWGEGDDEKVQIGDFEQDESGAIRTQIGSAEVVLPVGTTTCHLTFGDDDEAIDIGPFKVVRAE